jgi:hypothetical protein
MSRTPEEQKVADLLHRLAEHAGADPSVPTEPRVAAPPPPLRRPWTSVLVAAVVLAVVLAGTALVLRDSPENRVITSAGETPVLSGGTTERLAPSGLAGRSGAASVWTGKEVLIWGGSATDPTSGTRTLADGAALDPSSGRWRPIPPAPIAGRADAAVTWTGREMVIALGVGFNGEPLLDGAAFDPQANRWRTIAPHPAPGAFRPATVWTGTELLVVASTNRAPATSAYNPATDQWRVRTPPPGSLVMPFPQVVWTGAEAVYVLWPSTFSDGPVGSAVLGTVPAPTVSGGSGTGLTATGPGAVAPPTIAPSTGLPGPPPSANLPPPPPPDILPVPAMRGPNSGMFLASYSPATDRWTRLPDVALRDGTVPRLAWTGTEVLAFQSPEASVAFDPKRQVWRSIAPVPPPTSGYAETAVWTGRLVLLWSGGKDGLAYDPETGAWSTFDAGGLPTTSDPVVVWADGSLVAWSGFASQDGGTPQFADAGIRYRPPRR